jgi:retron-type reverse transcriptase
VIGRLNYFLESAGQLPPQQYGLTAGMSTADAIKAISEFVCHSRKLGLNCCLPASDIAGAFDNARHPGILARLWKLKCPPNIYSRVRDFLRERAVQITLGNSVSSKRVTKGCPQGSVSGPTLWNIIISDLRALLSNAPNVKIVVFAGDVMIMIRDPLFQPSSLHCNAHTKL